MTSSIKKYQDVSYKQLIAYAENNPNRHLALDSIEIDIPREEATLAKLGLHNYTTSAITPSGILGVLTYITDPNYYYLSPKNIRTQLLIDIATKLQQQTDELKNTPLSRKRKKIYDLIGAAYNSTTFGDKDYFDLFYGVSFMCNTHFILIKESIQDSIEDDQKTYDSVLKGEILFSSNPINWIKENPVWIVDYRGRWVAMPSDNIHIALDKWLYDMEKSGWIIQWPEVEGTKVELIDTLSKMPTWNDNDKKLSKDVLAVRLGKEQSINIFKDLKM